MSAFWIIGLVGLNLGLIFLLMAAPVGRRSVGASAIIHASRDLVWSAVYPLGANAGWSGQILSAGRAPDQANTVAMQLSWQGRDGMPIRRLAELSEVEPGERFSLAIVDDSSLDHSFWANYLESTRIADHGPGKVRITMRQTDHYRGAAFMVFRYFAIRRELAKLKIWAETGAYSKGGIFEHPLTQVAMASISALLLWPVFGLNLTGFVLATALTAVVAFHELGHMAAFRVMGHSSARMVFIPFLGGIAIGGRPYDSRFEVAFSALMGAGFSAFLVPISIAGAGWAQDSAWYGTAAVLTAFAAAAAVFNLANLVPIWKFDGGQVLRQICTSDLQLGLASFTLLSLFLALGYAIGLQTNFLIIGGCVFALLSIITAGGGVKLKGELKPISGFDSLAIAAALLSAGVVHGYGVWWAVSQFG